VVNLLQQAKTAAKIFSDEKKVCESQRDSMRNSLAASNFGMRRTGFRAGASGMSGLAGISTALGQCKVLEAILAEDSNADQFVSTKQNQKNIEKCERTLKTLSDGVAKIESVLKQVLRK